MDNCDETLIPPWDFKDPQIAKDPRAVPKDTLAATIVVEQLARILLKLNLEILAPEVAGNLEPMMNGLLGHLMVLQSQDGQPDQLGLLDGWLNYLKHYATNSKFFWGNCIFAIYSLLLEDGASGGARSQGRTGGLTIMRPPTLAIEERMRTDVVIPMLQ